MNNSHCHNRTSSACTMQNYVMKASKSICYYNVHSNTVVVTYPVMPILLLLLLQGMFVAGELTDVLPRLVHFRIWKSMLKAHYPLLPCTFSYKMAQFL